MELDTAVYETRPFRHLGSPILHHDPVGNHIIELREYCRILERKLYDRKELHIRRKLSESAKRRKIQEQHFPIPRFPKHYPFSHLMKGIPENKTRLRYMTYLGLLPKTSENEITFVEKVLLQTGYSIMHTPNETALIKLLSGYVQEFLRKFVEHLKYNKEFSTTFNGGQDLMGPLEKTLKNFGMDGISALHTFYYENVARKHDILYQKCEDLYIRYRENIE